MVAHPEKESGTNIAIIADKIKGKDSNFMSFNFNLNEFLNSLTRLELFAFISLCFNSVILNALISIVFIWYGEFLIKYFKLETRYPKLAKFIDFRRKLQQYSLKYNLFIIFICILPQLFVCLVVFWHHIF